MAALTPRRSLGTSAYVTPQSAGTEMGGVLAARRGVISAAPAHGVKLGKGSGAVTWGAGGVQLPKGPRVVTFSFFRAAR